MKTITISKVDIPLLKKQKLQLVGMVMSKDYHQFTKKQVDAVDGIINLLDCIQDEGEKSTGIENVPKIEIINRLKNGEGILKGSTRPTTSMQLDYWALGGKTFLITLNRHWNPNVAVESKVYAPYMISDIHRIELLTEITD